jgi:UDP-N-acetylglucosamine 2-epimerase (non-hydrolysing)
LSTADEQARVASVPCPYGDGRTSERVARIITDPATAPLLQLAEPDLTGDARPL